METNGSKLARFRPAGGPVMTFLLSFLMLGTSNAVTFSQESGIFAFSEIAPGLYRGGQPTEEGFKQLKALGIKTVVNFRNEKDEIEWDQRQAAQWGMKFVSIPWTIYGDPNPQIVAVFLREVEDPSSRPLFMHCRRGIERTGVMSALYYMKIEGLNENEAYRRATEGYPVRWYWRPFVKKRFDFLKNQLLKH